ncbi:MAG: hypothetical protein WDZ69_02450 [Candidatus Pacearchaeota archaeon]
MVNQTKNLGEILKRTDIKAVTYGMLSNWGLVILANIIGLLFVNTVGVNVVRNFVPFVYLILGIAFYFPAPKSRDFKIGYILAFVIGLALLTLFYLPLLS